MAAPEITGYADLTPIGHGGYAVVYRARQVALNRLVAVKVLGGATADPAKLARFERECAAIGTLSGHPNVVAVYDAGTTTDGSPYLSMEYLRGGTLADRIRLEGPLPAADVVRVGVQIADAIEVAHRAGMLHRDIKPENVLLDTAGRAKIADFGIAAVAGGSDTATGVILGTVLHAAPEVIEGARATIASDVYSLGSLLATLVLGHAPFARPEDDSPIPVMMRIVRDPLPDLRAAGVPDALAAAIERAMAREPDQRHPSAADLAAALRRLDHAPERPIDIAEPPTIPPTPAMPPAPPPPTTAKPAPAPATVVTTVAAPLAGDAPAPAPRRRSRLAWLIVAVVLIAGAMAGGIAVGWRHAHPSGPPTTAPPTTATSTSPTTASTPVTIGVATSLAQAEQDVTGRPLYAGYSITDTGGWHDAAPVAALVGTNPQGRQKVFLFAAGVLLGSDYTEPSLQARVVAVGGDTVTVVYSLYAAGQGPPGFAPVAHQIERFHYDGTHFSPLDGAIAPTSIDVDRHR